MSQLGKHLALPLAFLSIVNTVGWSQQQSGPSSIEQPPAAIPSYRITFKEGEPIRGIGAALALRLPFGCSDDGTVFLTAVQPLSANAQQNEASLQSNPYLLISVSPSGEAHSFPLDRVSDLHDLRQISEAAAESEVVFLVSATDTEDRAEKDHNARPERHYYLVTFDRQGNYQKKVQLEAGFRVTHLSLFSSESFLAYGFDEVDRRTKLAMLKDDGSFLRFLEISKGDAPESVLGTRDSSGKGPAAYLAPAELVPQGQYIYLLQENSDYPILRVSIAGAIESIKPKLPGDAKISMLIPSDENLYAIVHDGGIRGKSNEESIFELNAGDGVVLRRLQVSNDESADEIACVHDKKFFLFHHGESQLIPLIGTAQPRGGPNCRTESLGGTYDRTPWLVRVVLKGQNKF